MVHGASSEPKKSLLIPLLEKMERESRGVTRILLRSLIKSMMFLRRSSFFFQGQSWFCDITPVLPDHGEHRHFIFFDGWLGAEALLEARSRSGDDLIGFSAGALLNDTLTFFRFLARRINLFYCQQQIQKECANTFLFLELKKLVCFISFVNVRQLKLDKQIS
jgi:hypothetical protein